VLRRLVGAQHMTPTPFHAGVLVSCPRQCEPPTPRKAGVVQVRGSVRGLGLSHASEPDCDIRRGRPGRARPLAVGRFGYLGRHAEWFRNLGPTALMIQIPGTAELMVQIGKRFGSGSTGQDSWQPITEWPTVLWRSGLRSLMSAGAGLNGGQIGVKGISIFLFA
jgi:hypothetical protein